MAEETKHRFPSWLKMTVWLLLAGGILVVTASAIGNKSKEQINGVQVNFSKDQQQFIDKKEIYSLLEKAAGKSLSAAGTRNLNLSNLENQLKKNRWIKSAELFIDNNNTLQVNVEENIPVARVFTMEGDTYYLSPQAEILPVSDRFSARMPVFSGSPVESKAKMNNKDSLLLQNIVQVGSYILNSPFWMSQIDQVVITPSGKFEMIPKLGNQIIRFGDGEDCEAKFSKLLAFYKQVQIKSGWSKYSVIDVQYKNQIVAERRDAAQVKADSLASIRIMKSLVEDAKKKSEDTSRVQMPVRESSNPNLSAPAERQEAGNEEITPTAPVNKNNSTTEKVIQKEEVKAEKKVSTGVIPKTSIEKEIKKPEIKKPEVKKPVENKPEMKKSEVKPAEQRVPKAVMPSKSETEQQQ